MGDIKIIIMTESSKFSGKCVAGINVANGNWVRLVSQNKQTHGALSNEDLICHDGRKCGLLDIVKVPIIKAYGNAIQPENILIDKEYNIEIEGKATIQDVLKIHPAELRDDILGNKYPYIIDKKVADLGYSLALVQVDNLTITQKRNPADKPKTKAAFTYQWNDYQDMSVTDPKFYSVPSGTTYDSAYIVASIGTPYNNRYYKFIASIFEA